MKRLFTRKDRDGVADDTTSGATGSTASWVEPMANADGEAAMAATGPAVRMTPALEELAARFPQLEAAVEELRRRLAEAEVLVHRLGGQQNVAQAMAERQTRYSALDLAIKAAGPGIGGDEYRELAEGFLLWLRGGH